MFTVTSLADAGPGSLREAVGLANAAAGADQIDFPAGFSGLIHLTGGELTLTDGLTITGPGPDRVRLTGTPATRVFSIDDGSAARIDVAISGLSLADSGSSAGGGAIVNHESLTLTDMEFTTNQAASGGAIDNRGALTIAGSTFRANRANTGSGGAIDNWGSLTITNSTLTDCEAPLGKGGFIHNEANATCVVTGGVLSGGSAVRGGGLSNLGALTLTNVRLAANSAGEGGAVFNEAPGSATLTGCTLQANSVATRGGGILNLGSLAVHSGTFLANRADDGGAVRNDGTLTVTTSLFTGNHAVGEGGAVDNAGSATFTETNFFENQARLGGAVHNRAGSLTISRSGLAFNGAEAGAAILNVATATLTNSTVAINTATDGGAIENFGSLTAVNSTIARNQASDGGAMINAAGGVVTLNNSILARTIGGPDLLNGQGVLLGSNNLVQSSNSLGGLVNTIVADPLLGTLAAHGGTTAIFDLLPGSPAINAGNDALVPAGVTTDQRGAGFNRFVGTVDIGAFEVQARVVVPNVIKDDGDWGFTTRGTWALDTTGGFQGDHRVHPFGAPQGADIFARWTFQQPLGPGNYELFATWVARPTNATNATYRIFDGNTLIGTVVVNQRIVPADAVVGMTPVASLGVFHTSTGVFTVELSSVANGDVVADAIFDPPVGGAEQALVSSGKPSALDAALPERDAPRRGIAGSDHPRFPSFREVRLPPVDLTPGRASKKRGADGFAGSFDPAAMPQ